MAASDWQRALVALAATVVGAAIVMVLFWARSIFIPLTLAIFFSFVLAPVVNRVQRRGVGRTVAVVVTVGLLGLVCLGVGAVIAQQITNVAATSAEKRVVIREKLERAKFAVLGDARSEFGQLVSDIEGVFSSKPADPGQAAPPPAPPSVSSHWSGLLSPAAEALGQGAFTFILTVFMLLKREDLRNRMIRLLGAGRLTVTTKAVDDASQRISKYLFSQLLVNSAFGVVITIGLFALGLKYAVLWGFIAFLMRYVPYIGTWVGLIPPVLFSVATTPADAWGGGWGQPVTVLLLFIGLEALCNNLIEPYLYGQSMGLSEVAQLVSAAFWAFLWGPIGLILSGPLTVCLLVLGRHVKQFEFFVVLLGDQPALAPQVAFYQRLTARDQDEAAEVALEAAEQSGAEAALDAVVLPALCMARRDHHAGDLEKADLHFAVTAAREIAEEVAGLRPVPEHPSDARARILIAPARDEAEHVAAEVFALTLDPSRWEVKMAGDETLASELVEMVAEFRPAVVLVATLPPGGVAHARYLLTRLRQRHPEVKLLLGRWGADEFDAETRSEAVKNIDGVDRTLADSRKRLADLHATLVSAAAAPAGRPPRPGLVGTAGA